MPRPDRTPSERSSVRRTIDAAIRLLGDDSPVVVGAVQNLLARHGEQAREALLAATEHGEAATRLRARQLLRGLEMRADLRQLAAVEFDPARADDPLPLLSGVGLASRLVRTFSPRIEDLREVLAGEASTVVGQLRGRGLSTSARILGERLFGELDLRGSDAEPPQLDHVLVDRVLTGGVGTPVALAMIYLLVARFAGLQATGVAMPDHFLVRLHGIRPVLVDPFHQGRTITKVDCARYLRSRGYEQVREHLRDQTDREVLAHYMRALRRSTANGGSRQAHRTLGDALLHLEAR